MKPYAVAVIFARGGSKGVVGKNVRLLAGKPLVAYAVETARASAVIERVVVSTDDARIAEIARQYGAEIPFMRPKELAGDDCPEWLAWQHAIRILQDSPGDRDIDVFVSIPPTSPLRIVADVDACIQALLDNKADVVITVTPAHRNPYFNMVSLDAAGYARRVCEPEDTIHTRQGAPEVFDVTTVAYAARPEHVLHASSIFEGKVKAVVVPPERSVDIDTDLDFQFAEWLLKSGSGRAFGETT